MDSYTLFVQNTSAANSGSIFNFFLLWSPKPALNSDEQQSKQIDGVDRASGKDSTTPPSPTSVWSAPSSTRSSFNETPSSTSSGFSDSEKESASENEDAGVGPGSKLESESEAPAPEKSEIKVVFEKFDENKDGLICAMDLVSFAERLGFRMSLKEAKVLVESSDGNNDGRLDFEEFYSLYKSLGGCCPEIKRLTEEAGRVKEEEDNTMREAFGVYDTDKNGFICAKELQAVLKNMGLPEGNSLRRCERVIRRVASNPDSGITLGEFKSMMCCKSAPSSPRQ